MSRKEFDERIAVGYSQTINGEVCSANDVFDDVLKYL